MVVAGNALPVEEALDSYKAAYEGLGQAEGAITVIDQVLQSISNSGLENLDITALQTSVTALSQGASTLLRAFSHSIQEQQLSNPA